MTWELHRHDARRISELLEPNSVDPPKINGQMDLFGEASA